MKSNILLLLMTAMAAVQSFGQNTYESEGTISVSQLATVNPGCGTDIDEGFFTIAFNEPNGKLYTAFQMNVYLPDGLSFAVPEGEETPFFLNNSGVYPTVRGGGLKSHTISGEIQDDGSLLILVYSSQNDAFKTTSGDLVDIYVKASSYAKPGEVKASVRGIKFVTPSEDKYLFADYDNLAAATVGDNAKLDLKVTAANKIGTAIFPFDCALPSGVEAYTCMEESGDYLKLAKASSISAFTPYILYAENGFSGTLSGTAVAADYPTEGFVSDGYLTGVLRTTEVSAGYILQNHDGTPKFYRIGTTPFSLPAGKCYYSNTSSGAPAFILGFDETTGVNGISADRHHCITVYDLQGRKVKVPQSGGIYIINGEKVIKK